MIVVNDDYRLLQKGKVKEGGLARNEAILRWLKTYKHTDEIVLNRNRFSNAIIVLRKLRSLRNETIYIFYPTVGIPILKEGVVGKVCLDLFISSLNISCRYNRVVVDICDLKYEQSIDLGINKKRLNAIARTERRLFKLPCEFVFASESMKEYAIRKYNIRSWKCHVLDNGGSFDYSKTAFPDDVDKIKLVYAGTLNKGRCIEAMIECVKNNHNVILYLCGTGGDWIKEDDNVRYLGALDESSAHYIVSKCDIGLIPYDSSKQYYNIAYPTKLSFYITAGIPFISTDVKEVRKIHEKYNIGYIAEISDWQNLLSTFDLVELERKKMRIKRVSEKFTWDYKCKNSLLMEL